MCVQEEERDESDPSTTVPLNHPLLPPSSGADEDAQAILDDHLSRVLKTPGCQSPGVIRHSPRSCSPDRPSAAVVPFLGPSYPGATKGPLAGSRQSTKHIHHHYIHHHAGPKSKEQMEREAAQRVLCLCPVRSGGAEGGPPYPRSRSLGREMASCGSSPTESSMGRSSSLSRGGCRSGAEEGATEGGEVVPLQLPSDSTDRSQNVWQWILESDRQGKHHKPHR